MRDDMFFFSNDFRDDERMEIEERDRNIGGFKGYLNNRFGSLIVSTGEIFINLKRIGKESTEESMVKEFMMTINHEMIHKILDKVIDKHGEGEERALKSMLGDWVL